MGMRIYSTSPLPMFPMMESPNGAREGPVIALAVLKFKIHKIDMIYEL